MQNALSEISSGMRNCRWMAPCIFDGECMRTIFVFPVFTFMYTSEAIEET